MLGRSGALAGACLSAILLSGPGPAGAWAQERPRQLSGLLIDEAGDQLKQQTCTGIGNARVMYAAVEVLVREYDELKEIRQPLAAAVKDVSKTAQEKSCETTVTDLAPREGSTVPVLRLAPPTPGGGGKIQYGIPEMILATFMMTPEKRTEFLNAISPETNAAIVAWQDANPAEYERLSRVMQTKTINVPSTVWGQLEGYKLPTSTETWVLPKEGKLDWPSGATGLP